MLLLMLLPAYEQRLADFAAVFSIFTTSQQAQRDSDLALNTTVQLVSACTLSSCQTVVNRRLESVAGSRVAKDPPRHAADADARAAKPHSASPAFLLLQG
jgi:hypothetical protein